MPRDDGFARSFFSFFARINQPATSSVPLTDVIGDHPRSRVSSESAARLRCAITRLRNGVNESPGDSLRFLSPVSYLWCKMLLKIHMIILGKEIKYPEYQFLGKSRMNAFFTSRLISLIKIRR